MRPPHRSDLLIGLLCLAAAAYGVRASPEINGDGRLAYVYALVDRATAAVDRDAALEPRLAQDLALVDGHYYMLKPPLPALLAVPPYALLRVAFPPADVHSWWWRWALTALVSGGALALTALLLRRVAAELGFGSGAVAAAVTTAFATPLLVYGNHFFSHAVAALCLAAALWASLGGPRRAGLAGLAAGALVSTEFVLALAAAALAVPRIVAALRGRRARELGAIALWGIVGLLPLPLYLWRVFGSPVAYMYGSFADPVFGRYYQGTVVGPPHPDVLLAWLLSPQQGLVVFAPLAIVGAILLVRLARRGGAAAIAAMTSGVAVLIAVVALSCVTFYEVLPLQSQYGPRYLVPLLPLLGWPLATIGWRGFPLVAALAAVPQAIAYVVAEPMLGPEHVFQYAEMARRVVAGFLTPTLLSQALAPLGTPLARDAGALFFIVALPTAVYLASRRRRDA